MKKYLLPLLFSLPAFAQPLEWQFAPNFGYSNTDGFMAGLDSSLAVPLSQRWQWKFGGGFTTRLKDYDSHFDLETGAQYNFADDWRETYFVGAGIGYGNTYTTFGHSDADNRRTYAYADVGKRFKLNTSGSFAWMPKATVASDFKGAARLEITPVSFSWSF